MLLFSCCFGVLFELVGFGFGLAQHLERLMHRLAQCIASPHHQVSERAMLGVQTGKMVEVLGRFSGRCIEILLPSILKVAKSI